MSDDPMTVIVILYAIQITAMVVGPIACIRVLCVPSRVCNWLFTIVFMLPAIIYNFILAFFWYHTDTDWIKK